MSKLKRKWLRVLEFEEAGRALDTTTWNSLLETHPSLPLLQQPEARPEPADAEPAHDDPAAALAHDPQLQQDPQYPPHDPQLQHAMPPEGMMAHPPPEALMQAPQAQMPPSQMPLEPQIDHRLEQQLQAEMGPVEPGRGWAIAGAEQGAV